MRCYSTRASVYPSLLRLGQPVVFDFLIQLLWRLLSVLPRPYSLTAFSCVLKTSFLVHLSRSFEYSDLHHCEENGYLS